MTKLYICEKCGKEHGTELNGPAEYFMGTCQICNHEAQITHWRKFNYPEVKKKKPGRPKKITNPE